MDRLLTFWFRFTFPDKLTTPWPGFVNDMMKLHYIQNIVDLVFSESPLMIMMKRGG